MSKNNEQRLPPQSAESERAVLGCILIDTKAFPRACQYINQDSFYKKTHSIIFSAMEDLDEDGDSIDNVTLIEKLKQKKQLDVVGGAYFITGLSSEAPTAANVEYYAKIVKDKAVLRKIIQTAVQMSDTAYDPAKNSTEILDKAESLLFETSKDSKKANFQDLKGMIHDVLDNWGKRKGDTHTGIPTGFIDLDDKLSGLQKSDLIILAARPSMGKTALALNLARNAAVEYKHKVGIFSLEMSMQQLAERLLTSEAKVDSHLVRTGKLGSGEWGKIPEAASKIVDAPIFIDDSAGLSIMELRAKARQLVSEQDIEILFIDYIQLLSAGKKFESRQQEISYISRSLKALAKELNIPIVALSQLSRAPESRTDHRPVMSDLRESGAIEQDADVVLFIFRKFVYSKEIDDKGIGEIIISKHRNGPTGVVNVTFIDKYAKFDNQADTNYQEYYDGSSVPGDGIPG